MNKNDPTDGGEFDQTTLGRLLKETREYLGLSQQYVTSASGIPRSAISEIERGNRKVDSLELRRFAKVYGYPVSYFLRTDSEPTWPTEALGRVLTELTAEDHNEVLKFAEFLSFSRQTRKE